MARVLITGGAGFMGRWLAKSLIDKAHKVWVLDNLSNSSKKNIEEFRKKLAGFEVIDIKDREALREIFKNRFDICFHLAAAINVQESINNPRDAFDNNCLGTFNIAEECRRYNTKIVFVSSALIYETAQKGQSINEQHSLNPSCPYTASKIYGENLVISYYRTYNLPVIILRPFSIYGPWQRFDSEGGVMSIFIDRKLKGRPLEVFGDGEQSRDFFYIEDCAEFIVRAAFSKRAEGEVFNAGSGSETKIRDLARIIDDGQARIRFIKHPHLHAEVISMCADSNKAKKILKWEAKISLKEGINRTREWLKNHH